MNKIETMDEDTKQVKFKKPIIFFEWSAVNRSMLKRRDYTFKFLMEKPH
ncbi:MAG: hypothetical protein ACK4UP_10945 [Spirosomataceae bacterium]